MKKEIEKMLGMVAKQEEKIAKIERGNMNEQFEEMKREIEKLLGMVVKQEEKEAKLERGMRNINLVMKGVSNEEDENKAEVKIRNEKTTQATGVNMSTNFDINEIIRISG